MRTRRLDVYAIGNALVDYQIKVSDAELQDLRLRKGAMELVSDAGQAAILDALGHRAGETHAGGSAANTVVGLAQMGGRAAFAGSIGNDRFGRIYRDGLGAYDVELTTTPKVGQTGICLILITPDGERTMSTNLAVSSDLGPDDIRADFIAASRWLYVEGYLLTGPRTRAAAVEAMALARRHDTPVAISFSDGAVVEAHGDELRSWVREFADLVFANQREAAVYTGRRDPAECVREIVEDCDGVCVTHGAEGSYVAWRGEVEHVPAFPTTPVDLTGAGDMYAAGVLYGLTHGWPIGLAARLGSKAAHRVVLQMGARLPGTLLADVAQIAAEG